MEEVEQAAGFPRYQCCCRDFGPDFLKILRLKAGILRLKINETGRSLKKSLGPGVTLAAKAGVRR
jgi:hypothetical protein